MCRRPLAGIATILLALLASTLSLSAARAEVTNSVISTAQHPLALDVDSAGNVWIGYADGPDPEGVYVVPAASGTLFGVPVTAGIQARIFSLNDIQGILMSPAGHLFAATDSGRLYVITEGNQTVFGETTTDDSLVLLHSGSTFRAGLAMDSQGNLFSARKDWGGVGVFPAATGSLYGQAVTVNTPVLLTPLDPPWGGWEGDVAVDSADNLFVNTWFTSSAPMGVYVVPKTNTNLYGQFVSANSLTRVYAYDGVVGMAAGIDIDASDNIYVSEYLTRIVMLSPLTRSVMGQPLTANVAVTLEGSAGYTGQGIAVTPDSSSIISGTLPNTQRLTPVAPTPAPEPPPPTLASPPRNVTVTAGDASAAISWSPPAEQGSYPVSTYQASVTPSGRSCLATGFTCDITGLANGTSYTVRVRALTGAGWGGWSEPAAAFTPQREATPSLMIAGSRAQVDGHRGIRVEGSAVQLVSGTILRPWTCSSSQETFMQGRAQVVIGENGTFAWERRAQPGIRVYLATGDGAVKSNQVTIR